jgi:PEP-CTERM motif
MINKFLLSLGLLAFLPVFAVADISYTTGGSVYVQDFDTLTTSSGASPWIDDSTLLGWFSSETTYEGEDGGNNDGGLYSFGTIASTERALGSIASGTNSPITWALRLTNNTGNTMTAFSVTYDGEQWRRGAATLNTLTFDYKNAAAVAIGDAGFTSVPQLNFASPNLIGPTSSLDGNLPANRTAGITFTILGINWLAGEQLMLRFTDIDNGGADQGMSIDNFSFSAVPEPSTLLLGSLVSIGLVGVFRRRRV